MTSSHLVLYKAQAYTALHLLDATLVYAFKAPDLAVLGPLTAKGKHMYKSKKIKKAKIPVTVDNITKQQLETLKLELQLLAEPWKRQGVTIRVGKKAA